MPKFKYSAKDIHAKKAKGTLEANNRDDLVLKLRADGLYLMECKDITKVEVNKYKLKYKELANYSREVGTMLQSGLSLVRTFSIMCQREENKKIKAIYNDIYIKIQQGQTLSAAMEAQGKAFPTLIIQMYRAGEASGSMDKAALIMADQYTKDDRIYGKTKSAMIYPIILMVVTVLVLLIVYLGVMPSFFDLFKGQNIPLITQINIGISKALQAYWYFFLLGGVLLVALIMALVKIPAVRYQIDKMKVKAPKFGKLMVTIYTSRFSRTLCSLYTSGISIVNAMQIARSTVGNVYIESQFDEAIKKIRTGESLSNSIKDIKGFDIKLYSSIFIGEESGQLETMLTSLSDNFDFESEQASERMVTLLQPIMIIFLAAIICLIVISVLLPIYSMYNNVGSM